MAEFTYLDESLDINQTPLYHLSIQVMLNGLSFSILNTVNNKYIALKHYPLPENNKNISYAGKISEIIRKDEFLLKNYKSLALMVVSFKSTLVPSALFTNKDKEIYFRFNHPLEDNESILVNRLKRMDAYCLFTLPAELQEMFKKYFPDASIFHQIIPFLDNIIRHQTMKRTTPAIHVNIHDEFFDIAVFREQSPELINSFYYKQVNDLVYFILYTIKSLKIDPVTAPLILSGKINPGSSLPETLRRYMKHISFAKRDPSFTYSYTFNMITEHSFANLFNLYPCV